jgi:anti-sigma-K factor RskA
MTPQDDDIFTRLERALAEAHRSRTESVLGPDLAHAVMRDIHRLTAHGAQSEPGRGWIDGVVWRIAMVTAGFAAIVAVSAMWYAATDRGTFTALVAEEFDEVSAFGE